MSKRTVCKEVCHECPFAARVPGWLGHYEDPDELLQLVRVEQEFPCHMRVDYDSEEWQTEQWDAPRCRGYFAMARRMAKSFRNPEVEALRNQVERDEVPTPQEFLRIHREGMHSPSTDERNRS